MSSCYNGSMITQREIEGIKASIAREIHAPRSEWTVAELMTRLAFVEQMERVYYGEAKDEAEGERYQLSH